ncbi:MAG: histidine kinase dimerization/phospho-acceptor domain-containing protein, partial [Acidobacteriota bacterium]
MFRSRFLWKLYVGYALLILLTTGIVGGLVALQIARRTLAETDLRLQAEAVLLLDIAATAIGTPSEAALQPRIQTMGKTIGTRLTVIGPDGVVLADSEENPALMDNHGNRPEVLQTREVPIGTASRFSQTLGQRMRYLALPIETEGAASGWVRTSLPLTSITSRLEQLRNAVLVGAAVAAVVALGLGFLFARRVTQPVLSMALAADRIAAGDYEKQVEIGSNDELGALARAFNVMSRHLRTSIETINADRRKLTAILSSMVEGVVAADRDERVVHMNAASGQILGVDPETAVGQPIWSTIRVREVSEAISEALRREKVVHRVVRLPGSPDRILDLHASPLDSGNGVMAGVVLVLDDITQLRRLETMRRDFFGNVSHELKTPVTAIRALVETVLDDPEMPPPMRRRFLGKVRTQTERLSSLVSDLLSLSRLESETAALDVEPIDVREPIEASIRALSVPAASAGVELVVELPAEPVIVVGDPEALQQGVSNLIDNAVKYS